MLGKTGDVGRIVCCRRRSEGVLREFFRQNVDDPFEFLLPLPLHTPTLYTLHTLSSCRASTTFGASFDKSCPSLFFAKMIYPPASTTKSSSCCPTMEKERCQPIDSKRDNELQDSFKILSIVEFCSNRNVKSPIASLNPSITSSRPATDVSLQCSTSNKR